MLDDRAKRLKSDLARLQRQHRTQRRARARNDTLSISLVGYTNAGKSTLFNALTKAGAYAANQLFATLDTTSRRMFLDGLGNVVLSDTVGFIRDLPTQLVEAFRATLDETVHADLLLHVVDASSPVRHEQIEQVNRVLAEIEASDIPQIVVMNKIDAAPELLEDGARVERDEDGVPTRVFLSAREGIGLDALRQSIVEVAQWLANRPPEPAPFDPRLAEQARAGTTTNSNGTSATRVTTIATIAARPDPFRRESRPDCAIRPKVAQMTARIPLLQTSPDPCTSCPSSPGILNRA